MTPPPAQLAPLRSLSRHWLLALVPALLILATTLAVILWAPRQFSSEAKLYLRIGRESVSVDPAARSVGDPMSLHLTREHEIESAIGVMNSREIAERVVQQIGLENLRSDQRSRLAFIKDWVSSLDPVPVREKVIHSLRQDVRIEANPNSSVVSISYRDSDPMVAQSIMAAWVDAYQQHHANLYRHEGSLEFFEGQQTRLQQWLDEARGSLRDAKDEYGVTTLQGGQQAIEQQILELEKRLASTNADLAAIDSRAKALNRLLDGDIDSTIRSETTGKANEGKDLLRNALFNLEVEQKELQSRLVAGHPKLEAIALQVEQARRIVERMESDRTEVTNEVNPAFQMLSESRLSDQADRDGLVGKIQSIEQQLEKLHQRQTRINRGEGEVAMLSEKVRILEEQYASHAVRFEQARMDDELSRQQMTSIAVVQAPTLQHRPVSPNKPVVALLGLAAAILCAFSLPILSDHRQLMNASQSEGPPTLHDPVVTAVADGEAEWDFKNREQNLTPPLRAAVDVSG